MNFGNSGRLLWRLPAFALLALAAWLLAEIAFTAWSMARFEPPVAAGARPAASARDTAAGAPGSGLFGEPARPGSASGTPAVLRNGSFRLTGVVASADRKLAHAIIETGGASETYFTGDTVASGISLEEVRPNEVLLRRNGQILRLPLTDSSLRGRAAAALGRSALPAAAGGMGDELLALPRESLSQLINMEPVMDAEGRMEGYRLTPRARRAWFDSLGLVSGDLLVAVNGVAFNSGMAQARQEMSTGNDMMLTIRRDGEQLEITVGSGNFGPLAM